MRTLALSLVILMCVSVSQAAWVYDPGEAGAQVYDFENYAVGDIGKTFTTAPLPGGANINDGTVGFTPVANPAQFRLTQTGTNEFAQLTTATQEQMVSSMLAGAGTELFVIDTKVTNFEISFTENVNQRVGSLVGIWIDGVVDPASPIKNNVKANNELESVLQFGYQFNNLPAGSRWRIRGAAGLGSTVDTNYGPNAASYTTARVTLLVSLAADVDPNTPDEASGSASLRVEYDESGTVYAPPNLQNVNLQLDNATLSAAQKAAYRNPANWTGWICRSQISNLTDPNVDYSEGHLLDDLTLVPEPATLSLLVLGGLALIRRRR
jgi:hypothetical protein